MNEGYKAWEVLKSGPEHRRLGINRRSFYMKEYLYQQRCLDQEHGV